MNDDAELDLAARIRVGDPQAMRVLLDRKLPRIFFFARRILGDSGDVEDVAQETLVRTWQRAPDREPGGPGLDAWMHKVALNLCLDRLRRRRETFLEVLPDLPDEGAGPAANLEAIESRNTKRKVQFSALSSIARLARRRRARKPSKRPG